MSKEKGNSFEREVAKKLSLWWSNNNRIDLFWRINSSGARHTCMRSKYNIDLYNQDGDITSTHPLSMIFCECFMVECKFYKDIKLWTVFTDSSTINIRIWWKIAREKAAASSKNVFLVVKQNGKPVIVIVDERTGKHVSENCGVRERITMWCDSERLYVFRLDEFVNVDTDKFKELCLQLIEEVKNEEEITIHNTST